MLYGVEQGHKITEATKNIFVEDEGTVNHSTINGWLKKFLSSSKILNDQEKSGRPKSVNSNAVLQAVETNRVCFR